MARLLPKLALVRPEKSRASASNRLPRPTDQELHRILHEWNDTAAPYPEVCAHELFEQQAARTPDATALIFKGACLSYREVNERANQLARSLQKREIGPEVLVGICLERRPEWIIALLGVWKAGGAYVPLDPEYPQQRLSFMANDAEIKLLLTDQTCKGLVPLPDNRVLLLDSDWPVIEREKTENLEPHAEPSNLAYVMYTSGSTGQPKGAMVTHSGLVNYLWWDIRSYPVEPGGCVPFHSSIAFDFTIPSFYPPLLTGGQIELIPENTGAQGLLEALRRMKNCSRVNLTPAHFQILNQQLNRDELAGITKTFVIAGENLMAESLSQWRDFAPNTRLVNLYGPTETVIGSSTYEVRTEDPRTGSVSIGTPISNTQIYILDAELHPVTPGESGELCIGGAGVARGYLNRPELTAEKFVPDPFSRRAGANLYRTGDLARHRPDGTLEYLGRMDNQVKIRGCRIELGEIEANLTAHPAVRSCTVLVREDPQGHKHLVAYLIPAPRQTPDTSLLRDFLKRKLPDVMVPAQFVLLESFPLTPNGKVDRAALSGLSSGSSLPDRGIVAPFTETEKKLAAIWKALLSIDRIGIYDDFFDLGGDSLLAVNAMLQIQEEFEVVLSMESLFPRATIADLARAIAASARSNCRLAYAAPIQPSGNRPIFFCIGAGTSLRPLAANLGSEQPLFSIGLEPGRLKPSKTPHALELLGRHVVSALREKQPEGPYFLGGFCRDALLAYEVARQLTADGQSIGLLAFFEPVYPRQTAAARISTLSRRMAVRFDFRLKELRKLGSRELLPFARSRWKNLRWLFADMTRNFAPRSEMTKCTTSSGNLKRIVFPRVKPYKPEPLDCPAVIFRCKDWPILSADDPYFGWHELLTGSTATCEVPGDHLGMFQDPNVRVIADRLQNYLDGSINTSENEKRSLVTAPLRR